jgi:hypothetical protein
MPQYFRDSSSSLSVALSVPIMVHSFFFGSSGGFGHALS